MKVVDSMRTGKYDAQDWMKEYDLSSKLCFNNQENIVYYANKKTVQNFE